MSKSKPLFVDINGAPFKIGDTVRVICHSMDETFNQNFQNDIGIVEYFEYECGCGQTYPEDPMIGVKFSDNILEEFWLDELNLVL